MGCTFRSSLMWALSMAIFFPNLLCNSAVVCLGQGKPGDASFGTSFNQCTKIRKLIYVRQWVIAVNITSGYQSQNSCHSWILPLNFLTSSFGRGAFAFSLFGSGINRGWLVGGGVATGSHFSFSSIASTAPRISALTLSESSILAAIISSPFLACRAGLILASECSVIS